MNLVKRWAILALAFWLTTFIVSGIQIQDGAWNYFWVAALFGVINTVLVDYSNFSRFLRSSLLSDYSFLSLMLRC